MIDAMIDVVDLFIGNVKMIDGIMPAVCLLPILTAINMLVVWQMAERERLIAVCCVLVLC